MWFKNLIAKVAAGDRSTGESLQAINSLLAGLSLAEAKKLAQEQLSDPRLFKAATDQIQSHAVSVSLPASAEEFVSAYAEIDMCFGDFVYERRTVGPSSLLNAAVRLATCSAEAEVVIRPGQDEVFVIDGAEPAARLLDDRHASIWHYVLWATFISHPEVFDQVQSRMRQM